MGHGRKRELMYSRYQRWKTYTLRLSSLGSNLPLVKRIIVSTLEAGTLSESRHMAVNVHCMHLLVNQ